MTKTPNQTANGGEIAYAAMLSTPGSRTAAKNRWLADRQNGDSMWPVVLLVMTMIGTAAVASSAYFTDQAAPQSPGTRSAASAATGVGAALSVDRVDARISPTAELGTPERLTVRAARADLRAGPSLQAEVVAGVRRGQTVLAIAVADGWTGVRLPDSGATFGWIRSSTLNQE